MYLRENVEGGRGEWGIKGLLILSLKYFYSIIPYFCLF